MSRAVDVGATVGADGVSIRLPRLRMVVKRRQAERLRDVLNTILPPKNEQAARPHLLIIYGDVEPELHEYATASERFEAARAYRRAHPDDGLYRVDVAGTGKVAVASFTGRELETKRRCVLCRCAATAEAYGFPVCEYHTDHTEDDAPCPKCYGSLEYWSDQNGNHWCDQCAAETAGLTREAPQPDAEWWCHVCSARLVADAGSRTADDKLLPSENLPCPACEAWADGGRILTEEQWTAAVDALCIECGVAGRTRGMHA